MSLIEHTLWGDRDKVEIALERLRQYEPEEGYYLAFSGGKDSVTIFALAEMSGVKFDAHYQVTTVDPPELVKFIKALYPEVERHKPPRSMFQLILDRGWPPMRQQRWCCQFLKESAGAGRVIVTGIRWEESQARRKRRMVEACYTDKTKTYLHPIIDWTEHEVWTFIKEQAIDVCGLYAEGFKRLGCILCPLAGDPKKDIRRWPKFATAYMRTFDRLIVQRAEQGKVTSFATGQEMFNWWIQRNQKGAPKGQMRLFE